MGPNRNRLESRVPLNKKVQQARCWCTRCCTEWHRVAPSGTEWPEPKPSQHTKLVVDRGDWVVLGHRKCPVWGATLLSLPTSFVCNQRTGAGVKHGLEVGAALALPFVAGGHGAHGRGGGVGG